MVTLARALAIPLVNLGETACSTLLVRTADRLELRSTEPQGQGPVYADFAGGWRALRGRAASRHSELLVRSVCGSRGQYQTVVDATAGLGRDAYILACAGLHVRMVERSPIVAALLTDGLRRAGASPAATPAAARLRLTVADALAVFAELSVASRPDVIYLDPMHPPRRKTALGSGALRLLRRVVGNDVDAPALLRAALICARHRVVVKRPRLTAPIAGPAPSAQRTGRTTRFDIYLTETPCPP